MPKGEKCVLKLAYEKPFEPPFEDETKKVIKRDYLLFSLVNSSEVLLSGVGWEFAGGGGGGGERLGGGGGGGGGR